MTFAAAADLPLFSRSCTCHIWECTTIVCGCAQVKLLHQQLQLRTQRGEVKKNTAGEVTDRESRVLVYQISTMMRPIQFDEEETTTLQDSEARYLRLALTNYHRFSSIAAAALLHGFPTALPCPALPCTDTAESACICNTLQHPQRKTPFQCKTVFLMHVVYLLHWWVLV